MNMRQGDILGVLVSGTAFPEVIQSLSHKHPALAVHRSREPQLLGLHETLGRHGLQVTRRHKSGDMHPRTRVGGGGEEAGLYLLWGGGQGAEEEAVTGG